MLSPFVLKTASIKLRQSVRVSMGNECCENIAQRIEMKLQKRNGINVLEKRRLKKVPVLYRWR